MNVSGLVVTVHDLADFEDSPLLDAIRTAGPFTLGDRFGSKFTLALEANDDRAAADWHAWLCELPGVVKVDVAFVYFDPPTGDVCEGGL